MLVAALFALSAANSIMAFIYLAFIPAFVFWGLDGYFLWQERIYRKLYDKVRNKEPEEIDFSMNTNDVSKDVSGWLRAALSKTLIPFHGVLIGAIIIVMIILFKEG